MTRDPSCPDRPGISPSSNCVGQLMLANRTFLSSTCSRAQRYVSHFFSKPFIQCPRSYYFAVVQVARQAFRHSRVQSMGVPLSTWRDGRSPTGSLVRPRSGHGRRRCGPAAEIPLPRRCHCRQGPGHHSPRRQVAPRTLSCRRYTRRAPTERFRARSSSPGSPGGLQPVARLEPPVHGLPLVRLDVTTNIGTVRLRHPGAQDRKRRLVGVARR
jgi:hypothetical protein